MLKPWNFIAFEHQKTFMNFSIKHEIAALETVTLTWLLFLIGIAFNFLPNQPLFKTFKKIMLLQNEKQNPIMKSLVEYL